MDRTTPLVLSSLFYSGVCYLLTKMVSVPKHLEGKDRRDFIGQHVSFVHASLAVVFASVSLYLDGGVNYDIPMGQRHISVFSVTSKQHSLGYVLYDTVYAEVFGIHDTTMRLHHVIGFLGGFLWVSSDHGGSVGNCNAHTDCVFAAEISNPAMEARLILKGRRLEHTTAYTVVELIFAATFLFFRTFAGALVAYNSWASSIETIVCIAISCIVGLGWHWCLVILCMMAKKARGALKQRDNNSAVLLPAHWAVATVDWLKVHQTVFHCLSVLGCLGVPLLCGKVLGLGAVHVHLGGFQVA